MILCQQCSRKRGVFSEYLLNQNVKPLTACDLCGKKWITNTDVPIEPLIEAIFKANKKQAEKAV